VSLLCPPIVGRASQHSTRTAIIDGRGKRSYQELRSASAAIARQLLADRADLGESRVAFLVPPSFDHVAVQWGIWRAGGLGVPLPMGSPESDLDYFIRDSGASTVVCDAEQAQVLKPIAEGAAAGFFTTAQLLAASESRHVEARELPVDGSRRATMVYTSGTTGRPKGVVATHANITSQIESLVSAWEWTAADRTLLVLPLHHVHGIINVVCCALWSGATLEMLPRFDAEATWLRIASGELTVFTAVPTIYHRLIQSWEAAPAEAQRARSRGCRRLRLMMSGSAALPRQILERWREISGHVLLERYGMTEVGMALSNPIHGERLPGFVGLPLPGVSVRLVDERQEPVVDGQPGEVQLRGAGVFSEYWGRPESTRDSFTDGWFRTGDIGVREGGAYRLLGRSSVDIIKSGGDKISAIEVEDVLRAHPAIAECAVVGVDDREWGQCVCAAVETRPDCTLTLPELREWAKSRLAPYKMPRHLLCVSKLPRNAMGKVVKPEVAAFFAPPAPPGRQAP
jgi:malonyl-CoA/methylmalonyl-CoA synthetase